MTAVVAALHISERVKDYGAYAGFAAVFGLGVLAMLYFAQAREVKRLREWAGRAPERAAELEQRVTADAQQRRATPAAAPAQARPAGAATPAGAAAAAAAGTQAAKPGQPAPAAAGGATTVLPAPTPGAPANGAPDKPGEAVKEGVAEKAEPAKPDESAKDGDAKPAVAATAAGAAAAGATAAAKPDAAKPAEKVGPDTGPNKPVPMAAAPPRPRQPAAAPLRAGTPSATVPPRTAAGARGPGAAPAAGGRSRRTIAAVVVGVLVLAIGGGFAAASIFGGKDDNTPAPNTVESPGASGSSGKSSGTKKAAAPAVNRRAFTVAVLNGTPVTGLARNASDKVVAKGYKPGTVASDTTNQQRQETQVLYDGNAKAAAADVAKILQVKPSAVGKMDPNAKLAAGGAQVIVYVGADKAQ